MKKWFYGWLVLAAAFIVAAAFFPGIHVDWHPGVYLIVAAVFGLINLSLARMLKIMSMPVMVLTLGLFALVINTFLLILTAWLMDSVHIDNIAAAFGGAVLISIVRAVLGFVVDHVR